MPCSRKKIKFYLLFIVLMFNRGTLLAQQAHTIKTPNTYALVMGISGYQNAAIPRLEYADKDARLFSQWLQTKAGGSVPGYQVKLLVNEDAKLANVYSAFEWLQEVTKQDDIVYIYFSGHGDVETNDSNSKGYLLAWNSPATNYRNNAIAVSDLNETANSLTTNNKAKVILITDACHSGKMAGDFYKGRQLTAENLRLVLNNQVRLAACEAHELAAEGPAWDGGRGVFSYYLLKGLQGQATPDNAGVVRLSSLTSFIDHSFRTDRELIADKHKQHPVIDGSPLFPLAKIETGTLLLPASSAIQPATIKPVPLAGLQSLKALGTQPIDSFFSIFTKAELDTILDFQKYYSLPLTDIPHAIVNDYFLYQQQQHDSLTIVEKVTIPTIVDAIHRNRQIPTSSKISELQLVETRRLENAEWINYRRGKLHDSVLINLQKQLSGNRHLVSRFNEKFVQGVHEKSQEMINAYLNGDLAEIERRQYYYAGNRQYRSFLAELGLATQMVPETHYLFPIFRVNFQYLSGLVARLEMATTKDTGPLLAQAFFHQRQALKLEPYAAYIHNELGNLYLFKKIFDSATTHFRYAKILSPAWAVPWSNMIRLHYLRNDLAKAKEAIRIADSLQPNLAYVFANAGLVMEKDSNWLSAESYYLQAIAKNNVHYLPFERLGFVYLQTGRYALADSFLREAKSRKEKFSINEEYFAAGKMMMPNVVMPTEREMIPRPRCNISDIVNASAPERWLRLAGNLQQMDKNNPTWQKQMERIAVDFPALPLIHHYLGLQYIKNGQWTLAEKYLEEAVLRYLPSAQFRNKLETETTDSCLLAVLAFYHYDDLDDYYLLTKIAEKKGDIAKALRLYEQIIEKENARQMNQAAYREFERPTPNENMDELRIIADFEVPIPMYGSLKAAALLENQQRFEEAERILLQQVLQNQEAGYARQAALDSGNYGPTRKDHLNEYFLLVSHDLEIETYNFYTRMLARFPRDAEWYQRAGFFLYNRLFLSYARIPIEQQNAFYQDSKKFAFPYRPGMSRPNNEKLRSIKIPATGEMLDIEMKRYDPLQKALDFLQNATKYSGEKEADPALIEAMAKLNQWMGNTEISLQQYRSFLKLKPSDTRVRRDFISLLEYHARLSEAAAQLSILHTSGELNEKEKMTLAYYASLDRNQDNLTGLLGQVHPQTPEDKIMAVAINLQNLINKHEYNKAIEHLDMESKLTRDTKNPPGIESGEGAMFYTHFDYTRARLLAMTGKKSKAWQALKKSLAAGFEWQQVLGVDPVWSQFRATQKWKNITGNFRVPRPEEQIILKRRNERTNQSLNLPLPRIWLYRIPGRRQPS